MKTKDISQARDKDLRSSMAALLRAAASAREIAIQTGTAIVIHKEGKLVRISAEELRKSAGSGEES